MLNKNFFAVICIIPLMLSAQIDNAGVIDRHFYNLLFPEVYKELASTKINYPGIRHPEKQSITGGLLPDLSGESWAALYGWGEWANGPAVAGVWLGNIGFSNSSPFLDDGLYTEYDPYINERVFSLRSAAWFTPFRSSSFKGISVTYDASSKRREDQYMGGTYNMDSTFFGVISLIELNANLHLRVGIGSQNYAADQLYMSDEYLELGIMKQKRNSDAITLGVLDSYNRKLELQVSNVYHFVEDFFDDLVNDTVNVNLVFSGGKMMPYHKHRFFYGFKGKGGVSLPSKADSATGRLEYWRHFSNARRKGAIYGMGVSSPLIFDVRLFRTVRGMLSVDPQINYTYTDYPEKLKSQHNLRFISTQPLLSIYGGIGDKVEFAFKPSIENDVFFSAAEVRYKF
ncbi:MAG: hypothetical protein FWE57_05530 [Chitinispirillia bacterium]|nr:hypothetical protein [Chitinispirillia bacterium]